MICVDKVARARIKQVEKYAHALFALLEECPICHSKLEVSVYRPTGEVDFTCKQCKDNYHKELQEEYNRKQAEQYPLVEAV